MKNITVQLRDIYHDEAAYEPIANGVYRETTTGSYKLTLCCELEAGENAQYPLEDVLDKYYVNCTDFFEETVSDGKTLLTFELEGSLDDGDENRDNILAVAALAGKRVFNYEEGNYIKLGIE